MKMIVIVGFPLLELSLYKIKRGDMQGLCANQLAVYTLLELYCADCFTHWFVCTNGGVGEKRPEWVRWLPR